MKKVILLAVILLTAGFVLQANDRDLRPTLISPGDGGNSVIIEPTVVEQSCPTFSWTYVPWAVGYKIVVFKSDMVSHLSYEEISATETPVIVKDIKGGMIKRKPLK